MHYGIINIFTFIHYIYYDLVAMAYGTKDRRQQHCFPLKIKKCENLNHLSFLSVHTPPLILHLRKNCGIRTGSSFWTYSRSSVNNDMMHEYTIVKYVKKLK